MFIKINKDGYLLATVDWIWNDSLRSLGQVIREYTCSLMGTESITY